MGTSQNFTPTYYFLVIHSLITQTELHHSKESLHSSRRPLTAPGEPPQLQGVVSIVPGEPPRLQGKPWQWQPLYCSRLTYGSSTKLQDDFHGLGMHSRFHDEPPQLQGLVSIARGEPPLLQGELRLLLGWPSNAQDWHSTAQGCATVDSEWASRMSLHSYRVSLHGSWVSLTVPGWAITVPRCTSIAPCRVNLNESLVTLHWSRLSFCGSKVAT